VLPGSIRPSGLAEVPRLLLAELERSRRGVVVLAVDGLSHGVAAAGWPSAEITSLTSTFPSTSATAWLTALTGCEPSEHGVPGMVYRVDDALVYAVTGAGVAGGPVPPDGVVLARPTVFERAGVPCLALGRELDHLPGPWARALLRGTAPAGRTVPPAVLAEQAADPRLLAGAVAGDVTAALAGLTGERFLLWVYVNLDDHVHANGYDDAAVDALAMLDRAATEWARDGWTVVAHSDHGQVPVRPDPELAAAWAEVDDPADCELPGGGAGRTRWLYPRPGRADAVRARLAEALGDAAVVVTPAEVGLDPRRAGAVVAIAASDRFPIPDPGLRFEHGGLDADEMIVPFAVWRPR
jgi:hypothetical protein